MTRLQVDSRKMAKDGFIIDKFFLVKNKSLFFNSGATLMLDLKINFRYSAVLKT